MVPNLPQYFTPWEFFFLHRCKLMVFYWSLSDSKSPQVSRTFLSILADLITAVVWMVSILPLIFNSSSISLLGSFFLHRCKLMVFYWSLSDSKSPQVSRTFLSILADLITAVVWMVSILPLIFNSSSISLLGSFFFLHRCKLMVFYWSLSDSKSPQVFRTLLSILANLKKWWSPDGLDLSSEFHFV